ncbi:DNA polymerase IV [Salinigranum halophilum]|jgi:DNA polymerase IV (DinB-like DNA polymerase)|uniref:DNA polymerase IV n=1 Tax=Salinigranum halophilum TaxID=2565931 RepID=UPI00115E6064|nr:DNA polymerase IV [Salinigranum halophilum]
MADPDDPFAGPPAAETEARVVLHVDMDCFYASCERRRHPELDGEPVVVGMGFEPGETHGAVATASYEARAFGIDSAQPISQALDVLPRVEDGGEGHYLPVDLDYYREVAAAVKTVLRDCADVVREVSIDEAYLDVSERTSWERAGADGRTLAEGYGRYVKQRISREVGVPASVGVAPNMSTAKVASDHDKPDGLVAVPPSELRSFLAPLPVDEIHGVGPVTARDLREMGIETAGDLGEADPTVLRERFGDRGVSLHRRARGDDDRVVEPTGRPKSLSRESAFTEATDESERVRERVRTLASDVATRATDRGATYRTIGVKVVTPPFDVNTRERSLSGPVDDPGLVERVALDLLSEFEGERVRKVGVRVSNLTFGAGEQARLDGYETDDEAGKAGGLRPDGRSERRRRSGQASLAEFDADETGS